MLLPNQWIHTVSFLQFNIYSHFKLVANSYRMCSFYSFKVNSFKILNLTMKFPKNYLLYFYMRILLLCMLQTISRSLYLISLLIKHWDSFSCRCEGYSSNNLNTLWSILHLCSPVLIKISTIIFPFFLFFFFENTIIAISFNNLLKTLSLQKLYTYTL